MLIPWVTQALRIPASMVFGFLAVLVLIPDLCSKAVGWAIPSFGSSSSHSGRGAGIARVAHHPKKKNDFRRGQAVRYAARTPGGCAHKYGGCYICGP